MTISKLFLHLVNFVLKFKVFISEDHVYPYVGAPASEAARRRAARRSRLKIQMFAESSSVAEELVRNYSSLSDYEEEPEKKEVSQSHVGLV